MTLRVLVVAAHADDEALGCGGALIRHARQEADIGVVFLTNGVGSRDFAGRQQASARREAMRKALRILGVTHQQQLDFPDNATDTVPLLEVVKSIKVGRFPWGVAARPGA